jgi:hypothetical protein
MTQHSTDRIILARNTRTWKWRVIDEKSTGYVETAMSTILFNPVNKYAEYENCGVAYRMIRRSHYAEYDIPADAPGIPMSALHA